MVSGRDWGHNTYSILQSFVDRANPASGRIVTKLSQTLGFQLQDDVKSVMRALDAHVDADPSEGRGGGRRRGGARRDLLREVTGKWPELGDAKKWEKSPLLKPDNQEKLLAELKQLPSWKRFDERQKQTETTNRLSARHELREVKFRRLIKTLETLVLEKNLPRFATAEVIAHYQKMMALEGSSLGAAGN